MESLRWRRLEPTGGLRTERLRPVVRRAGPTGSRGQGRLAIAAGGAAIVIALGLVVTTGAPSGSGAPGAGAQALAAVAPDVAGRAWIARRGDDRWVWGRAGVRERALLPEDESGLAITGRWLATGISTPATTRVRIRELDTGAVVLEQDLGFRAAAAAFAGDQLLVTGYLGAFAGADGGIVAIRVPGGELRTLVATGPFPARLGAGPSKGDFHVSASGALAAVNTCGARGCDNVVIDVATLTARIPRNGAPGFLRAVTDEVLVLTDADGAWVKGINVRTGREAYTIPDASLMEPASMADRRVIADVGRGAGGWQVAAIDGRGALTSITDLTRGPGPWVWPALSSPTVAVLGDEPFDAALAGDDATATLVRGADLSTAGTLVVQPGE